MNPKRGMGLEGVLWHISLQNSTVSCIFSIFRENFVLYKGKGVLGHLAIPFQWRIKRNHLLDLDPLWFRYRGQNGAPSAILIFGSNPIRL